MSKKIKTEDVVEFLEAAGKVISAIKDMLKVLGK